jgi:hypothetical protein
MASTFLGDWTYAAMHQECASAYSKYRTSLDAQYKAYFAANPELAGTHPQLAASFEQAMPPGMEGLEAKIPAAGRHRHYLSGKSSQSLGLGLLGAAIQVESNLLWFEQAISPVPPFSTTEPPQVSFEHEIDSTVLNEHPRVTAIDFFVETADAVICTEIKWAEEGFGRCSCGAGKPQTADCAERVLARTAYWDAARDIFFLLDRELGKPCPISTGYQAIRNAAAAIALANGRQPVFVLLYDANNPYFRPTDNWPGWPEVLSTTLRSADSNSLLKFRAVSWQDLVPAMPLPNGVKQWAAAKHRLL